MTCQQHTHYENLHQVTHPLLQHKLSLLRDKDTSCKSFRALVFEITVLLAYEATKNLAMESKIIQTPIKEMQTPVLAGKKAVVLPILRAGIPMVDAFLTLMPSARVGHIGLYRDEETFEPHCYYFKMPKNSEDRQVFVCDPMLATGGSAVETINRLKQAHIHNLVFICIVAAPIGVENLLGHHPDVTIYTASLDEGLNAQGYIVPGLGDAGDRLFGTK